MRPSGVVRSKWPRRRVVLPEKFAELGLDQSGRDGVDADVERAEFLRPTPGHHQQTRLGETVEQAARLRSQPGNGRDVDDRPAAFAFDHSRHNQPHQAKGGLDVDLDHLVQHVVVGVQRRALADVRRAVVDQNIHRAEAGFGFLAPDSRA